MPDNGTIIFLIGEVDDLYALSILFPEGAYPDLYVVSKIKGHKDGPFDRVTDASDVQTYVTGSGCAALAEIADIQEATWAAFDVVTPLNGYAILADSNFRPVRPLSMTCDELGSHRTMVFDTDTRPARSRTIVVDRHAKIRELRNSRVGFIAKSDLAASAALVIAATPSWSEFYRILEDIAGHRGTTLDKLAHAGLAEQTALEAFKKAANNRKYGRHGASKRDPSIAQESLMNLVEAREFVRQVVSNWIDVECGDRMPRDRVDGGPLRFGLDDADD